MQTSSRSRDPGPSFAARRGRIPQLSISDDDHHVTEAIGYMYEDEPEQDAARNNTPQHDDRLRLDGGASNDITPDQEVTDSRRNSVPRKAMPGRQLSNGPVVSSIDTQARPPIGRGGSWEQRNGMGSSPIGSRERSPSETATSQFPLNDIDYESSPAAVAQELSNLQALRRMSMDVAAAGDPDLPQLIPAGMPNMPSPSASEDDSSRLFWVPARLHPELAPKEFKSFLDSKAEQINRRSGELSNFSSPAASRSTSVNSLSTTDSGSGLRRKKSMLSRQIDTSTGYQDGADRLEHKKSLSRRDGPTDPNLQELESLVATAGGLPRASLESLGDEENGDIILPSIPGSSLKRSTRTTYRKGGSMKGRPERGTYAERAARRAASGAGDPGSVAPSTPEVPSLSKLASTNLSHLSQPFNDSTSSSPFTNNTTNFSRLGGRSPSPPEADPTDLVVEPPGSTLAEDGFGRNASISSLPEHRTWRTVPALQPPAARVPPSDHQSIPQIVEVPPPEEAAPRRPGAGSSIPAPVPRSPGRHPERVSSKDDRKKTPPPQRPPLPSKQSSVVLNRPPSRGTGVAPPPKPPQSLEQPSPLPGNDTNTANLSFIPTLTVDKRADHKKKEEPKKSGWGWLLGKEETEKEKDKEKPREKEKEKAKAKVAKPPQSHDNTRLDVLQTSIDGGAKGRESVVIDRDVSKLDEERKKESQRKSTGSDQKKEKEGLFSSIFGGKKAKAEKEMAKKQQSRGLSPEPPYREMRPDIDYNWTRFSILEERAIYRMAHIKLANPRRALYSQVLLSNFMYSYLAKVQQMHPQMNLPTSAKQQKKQQQQKDQPDEFTQYQRYQQQQAQQQQQQEQQQHQQDPQQQPSQSYPSQQEYGGSSSAYEYDNTSQRPSSRGSKHNVDSSASYDPSYNSSYHSANPPPNNYQPHSQLDDDDDDEMW